MSADTITFVCSSVYNWSIWCRGCSCMEFCSGSYQEGREAYVLVTNMEYQVGYWMK